MRWEQVADENSADTSSNGPGRLYGTDFSLSCFSIFTIMDSWLMASSYKWRDRNSSSWDCLRTTIDCNLIDCYNNLVKVNWISWCIRSYDWLSLRSNKVEDAADGIQEKLNEVTRQQNKAENLRVKTTILKGREEQEFTSNRRAELLGIIQPSNDAPSFASPAQFNDDDNCDSDYRMSNNYFDSFSIQS